MQLNICKNIYTIKYTSETSESMPFLNIREFEMDIIINIFGHFKGGRRALSAITVNCAFARYILGCEQRAISNTRWSIPIASLF